MGRYIGSGSCSSSRQKREVSTSISANRKGETVAPQNFQDIDFVPTSSREHQFGQVQQDRQHKVEIKNAFVTLPEIAWHREQQDVRPLQGTGAMVSAGLKYYVSHHAGLASENRHLLSQRHISFRPNWKQMAGREMERRVKQKNWLAVLGIGVGAILNKAMMLPTFVISTTFNTLGVVMGKAVGLADKVRSFDIVICTWG
jgi:hypothetical protein